MKLKEKDHTRPLVGLQGPRIKGPLPSFEDSSKPLHT